MPSEVTSQNSRQEQWTMCPGGGRGRMLVWSGVIWKGMEGKIDHPASYTR